MPHEGPGRGRRDGRRRGLHQRPGPAAPRRDGTAVRLGARPVDVGDVPAAVHLRARPPARRVAAGLLARLAAATPVLSDSHKVVFVDFDDTERQTYGFAKQGAGRGYTGVNGLNALLAVISTPLSAPLIAATRLRRGSAQLRPRRGEAAGRRPGHGTAGGCGRAGAGARGLGHYGHDIVAACRRAGARFSITARLTPRWSGRSPASMSRPGYRSGIRTRSTTRPSSGGSRRFR